MKVEVKILREWANRHPRTVLLAAAVITTLVVWAYAERDYLAWWEGHHFPDDWKRFLKFGWLKSFL